MTKKEIQKLVLSPIKNVGNEILKWEVQDKDTTKLIKVYHSGRQLGDSLKKSIDSTLKAHQMGAYHLLSMRINLSKEEVGQMSAETARQLFQEIHLDALKVQDTMNKKTFDTVSASQLFNEMKAAFPFVDTLSNGLVTVSNANEGIDTLPIIFYRASKPVGKLQEKQLYDFLCTRLLKDSVVLISR